MLDLKEIKERRAIAKYGIAGDTVRASLADIDALVTEVEWIRRELRRELAKHQKSQAQTRRD